MSAVQARDSEDPRAHKRKRKGESHDVNKLRRCGGGEDQNGGCRGGEQGRVTDPSALVDVTNPPPFQEEVCILIVLCILVVCTLLFRFPQTCPSYTNPHPVRSIFQCADPIQAPLEAQTSHGN